jgi:hypothetical protein
MLIINVLNRLPSNVVYLLKQCLRGGAVIFLVMALKSAYARPPVIVDCNFLLLEQHKEIPVQDYLVVAKDTQRDYRLRECAADYYALTYPASFREFIKMLNANDRNTRQIAEFALRYFGPAAREVIPHLMNRFGNLSQGGVQALINIGVDDRASLDLLLNLALNERNRSAIRVLSGQKSLPAYIGPLIISAIEKEKRIDEYYLSFVLLPIMDDLSIDYFIRFKIKYFVSKCGFNSNNYQLCAYYWININPWIPDHLRKAVGNIAIQTLVKTFWGSGDLDSKALSLVMLMGVDTPEATALAQQLVKEIIPALRADLLEAGLPKIDVNRFDLSLSRLKALGLLVNPLGKELLLLLDEQRLRDVIIDVLQEIQYVAALPKLRNLAIEDTDPEIRERAKRFIEHMEKMDRSK